MAIDLNGFGGIGSKFGALEGDRVLVEFSKMLRTVFRGATGAKVAVAPDDRKYVPTGIETIEVKQEEKKKSDK